MRTEKSDPYEEDFGNADVSVWNIKKDRDGKNLAKPGSPSPFHNET
jgi:hypothetical protein